MSQLYLVCPRCDEGMLGRDVCPWCVRGFVEAAEWTTEKYAAMQKRVRELLALIHDVATGEGEVHDVTAYYEQHKGDCLNATAIVRAEREAEARGEVKTLTPTPSQLANLEKGRRKRGPRPNEGSE